MATNPQATTTMADDHHHGHEHSCNDPSHHHHHHFDPEELFASGPTEKPKRKAKKVSTTNPIRSETIPGHRGNQNIDDLVNFINGPSTNTSNTKSKKK